MNQPRRDNDAIHPPPAPAGRRQRGSQFRSVELMHLLDIMLSVLPIGPQEWEEVAELHSVSFPGRDVVSLRRKFTTLHRKKIPTGDPNMPPAVRLAKQVKYAIADKAELGDGTGEFDILSDSNQPNINLGEEMNEENEENEEPVEQPDVIAPPVRLVPPPLPPPPAHISNKYQQMI